MKIQCRLDYFLVSKHLNYLINESRILPNIYSDHSAVSLSLSFHKPGPPRGPGFWKFNNSLLADNSYVEKLCFLIPQVAQKYQDVKDKGLYWEMIKMEIRAFTIKYSKQKAKATHNEEKRLLIRLGQLQESLGRKYNDMDKVEMNKIKTKLEKISAFKTRGTIIRSRARWYEFGEKNSKYFLNLEKTNHRKKHVTSLINDSGMKITSPKEILKEEETFFQKIYRSSNKDPNLPEFNQFFQVEKELSAEMAATCEGYITIEECAYVLKKMENNKTPGSDGLTVEFYRYFWNIIAKYMVESFNYAFQSGHLSISQKQGIISLIPKKKKNTEYLKNWRPVSLLNVDYKVATKTIATRLEKVLSHIIHPSQSGYIKGRFIGESIRQIIDIMEFTKNRQIPGIAIFLDFEKAFDSVEWDYIQKCLSSFNFGPQLRQWVGVFYKDISSCVLNNGHASKHFFLQRGVRQGCPLSGMLFVIAIELLAQSIRHSDIIKGIKIQANQEVKLTQYADDTTALLADVQSVANLFELLTKFESCSGLKINQSKSEMLWLGSLSHRNDAICNLRLSHEPVYALGVHFSYNHETAVKKKNFLEKLETLKKTLNMWSQRDISLQGRINIVKTLALSKLIICMQRLGNSGAFCRRS